jgi:hypothetical protein
VLTIYDNRKAFYQWDTGQKIIVSYPGKNCEVHFENPGEATALAVSTYKLGGHTVADVPDILLQRPGNIVAYVYVCAEEACTIGRTTFEVLSRQKPADYVYDEIEILKYSELEKRIDEIEDNGVSDAQIEKAVNEYLEENPVGGVTPEELTQEVENALEAAKASGEFDGQQGPKGDAGDPGSPGPAGADGYSPNVDLTRMDNGVKITVTNKSGSQSQMVYDGKDGTGGSGGSGEDGGYYTPSVNESTGVLSWLASKSGMPAVASANVKGPKGDTGDPGEDGGHYTPSVNESTGVLSWQASKSGMPTVASANVKGPKGDTGDSGSPGKDGYSPVRGTDYWTDADKAAIVADTMSELPTITLVATYVDGTSETFVMKGERL